MDDCNDGCNAQEQVCGEPQRGRLLDISKKYHDVRIDKVTNGFIVRVGCATFVSKSWSEVCQSLTEYWDDPAKAEKKFCNNNQWR